MARRSRSRVTGDDAPKTKKAEAKKSRADHLTSDQFFEFIDRVGAHQADAEAAGMELAAVYKDTDKLGIHRQAAKLFKRLDAKEPPQRNDMLRSFNRFVGWAVESGRWEGLGDMLDAAEQEAASEPSHALAREEDDADPAPAREDGPSKGNGETRALAAEKAAAPEADWTPGDDRPAEEVNKDLDNAGFTFAAGRAAGRRGDGPDSNPHDKAVAPHGIWERGRLQGASEGPEADPAEEAHAAAEEEATTDAAPKKTRRRAGGTGATASLH